MKVIIFAALLATVAGSAMAQDKTLIKNLQLRSSFDESAKKPSPAQFVFTIPKGKDNSWLVDAGLAYKVAATTTFTSKITAEYHKNTLIDKEQENFSGGYSGVWLQKGVDLQQIVTTGAKYVHDWEESSHSLAVTGNYSLFKATKGFRINAPGYSKDNAISYLLTPYVGFEYQQIMQTKTGTQTGGLMRGIANLSASFAFNRPIDPTDVKAPKKFLEFSADYTGRYAFINGTGNGEKDTFMLKAGASIYLIDDGDTQVSMGAKFNNGSNPLQGLKKQRFWQFSLNVQF